MNAYSNDVEPYDENRAKAQMAYRRIKKVHARTKLEPVMTHIWWSSWVAAFGLGALAIFLPLHWQLTVLALLLFVVGIAAGVGRWILYDLNHDVNIRAEDVN